MNRLFTFAVVVATICVASAEVVKFEPCDLPTEAECTIHEVRIIPCPQADKDKPCKIKRGKSATIEFDYTTNYDSSTAHGQVYSVTPDGDKPFLGMNTEACQHTSCPIRKSSRQTYAYTLHAEKKFPAGSYEIKWVLRNPEKPDSSTELCCFTTKVKLVR